MMVGVLQMQAEV